MVYYRSTFPVLPKMHLLESHVVPWIRKWNLGFGTMGESVHASFNRIERSFASMIHNRVYTQYVVHLITTDKKFIAHLVQLFKHYFCRALLTFTKTRFLCCSPK